LRGLFGSFGDGRLKEEGGRCQVSCCRECGASLEGAISSPTGCCSPSTICTPRGRSPPPWRTSSVSLIRRGGGRARGWGLSSTRGRAYSSSSSSSASCSANLCTHVTPALSVTSYPEGLFTHVRGREILRTSHCQSSRKLATSSPGTERRGLYPSGSRMKLYPPDLTFGGCCSNRATVPSHTTR
jgi:hypothetical protein